MEKKHYIVKSVKVAASEQTVQVLQPRHPQYTQHTCLRCGTPVEASQRLCTTCDVASEADTQASSLMPSGQPPTRERQVGLLRVFPDRVEVTFEGKVEERETLRLSSISAVLKMVIKGQPSHALMIVTKDGRKHTYQLGSSTGSARQAVLSAMRKHVFHVGTRTDSRTEALVGQGASRQRIESVGHSTADELLRRRAWLAGRISSSANWIFVIAGLGFAGAALLFFTSLVLVNSIRSINSGGSANLADLLSTSILTGIVVAALVALLFFAFGYRAKKKESWAFAAAMVFYGLDAVFVVVALFSLPLSLFSCGLAGSLGLHVFGLFRVYEGLRACNAWHELEQRKQKVEVAELRTGVGNQRIHPISLSQPQ